MGGASSRLLRGAKLSGVGIGGAALSHNVRVRNTRSICHTHHLATSSSNENDVHHDHDDDDDRNKNKRKNKSKNKNKSNDKKEEPSSFETTQVKYAVSVIHHALLVHQDTARESWANDLIVKHPDMKSSIDALSFDSVRMVHTITRLIRKLRSDAPSFVSVDFPLYSRRDIKSCDIDKRLTFLQVVYDAVNRYPDLAPMFIREAGMDSHTDSPTDESTSNDDHSITSSSSSDN